MARLGQRRQSHRLWWFAGAVAAAAIAASFGTPKVGCAGSPDDEADTSDDEPTTVGVVTGALAAIHPPAFCPTSGSVVRAGDGGLTVSVPTMRGVVAGDMSRSAELAFTFRGATKELAPLASGELRQQIGLKLRAHDTCNIVYVMWRVAPTQGVRVLVKSNPGLSTHVQCKDQGYINLPEIPGKKAPIITVGEPHTLRAELEAESLRVFADDLEIWSGTLPPQAFAFDGAVGVRSDNGEFDFELRVPEGGNPKAKCNVGGDTAE